MRFLSRICLLAGFSFSIYLATISLTSGSVAGCGGDSPCNKVLSSEWAYIGLIPVSIPAILVYGLLLAMPSGRMSWRGITTLFVVSIVSGIVFTVLWFVAVQLFILKQVCPICMTSHLFGSAGAILFCVNFLRQDASEGNNRPPLYGGIVLGAAATLAFVTLQIALPGPDRSLEFDVSTERIVVSEPQQVELPASTLPDTGTPDAVGSDEQIDDSQAIQDERGDMPAIIETLTEAIPDEGIPVPEEPIEAAPAAVEEPVPVYSVHGGKFTFPLDEIPGAGDRKSPNIMLNLIDFACDHCREHYRVLRKRAPWYEGEIFFGVMPLALNERCNPYFSMPGLPDYSNCEYARLALAVWRMEPDKYLEFVDWLCDEDSPPASLEASQWLIARKYAENLIGKDKLDQGWSDPWVDDMMHTLTELYGYNLEVTGEGTIPQQFLNQKLRLGSITTESSFNMVMGLNYPIEIRRRR